MTPKEKPSLYVWLSLAAAIAAAAWLYVTGADIDVQDDHKLLIAAIWRHVGYGAVLSPLLIGGLALFVIWRKTPIRDERTIIARAALWAFFLSSAICAALAVTGPLVVWTHGSDLKIFDWFVISNPVGKAPALHDALEAGHVALARLLPWIATLSGALALVSRLRLKPSPQR